MGKFFVLFIIPIVNALPSPGGVCTGTNFDERICTWDYCVTGDLGKCNDNQCLYGWGPAGDTNKVCRQCAHGMTECITKHQESSSCLSGFYNDNNVCYKCP